MANMMTCPHCGNPNCSEEDNYCFNCGKLLYNYCSDPSCPLSDPESGGLSGDMVYCPECGSMSAFAKNGYISSQQFPL